MATIGKAMLALLLVGFALSLSPAESPLPPEPHRAMNAAGACAGCHAFAGTTLIPHEFVVEIPAKCWECHAQRALGRSHPIGVDPSRSPASVVQIPADLPLENGRVSCGSCHNPHLPHLSRTRTFPKQPAAFRQSAGRDEIEWYQTFYLRKSDPVAGFEPLCLACHKDL